MDFNYLGFVNRILLMAKQESVDAITDDITTDAYKAQLAVQDCIDDLSNVLKVRSRRVNFTFESVVGQRTYYVPRQVLFPLISLKQKNTDVKIMQIDTREYDRLAPDDDSSGDPYYYYMDTMSALTTELPAGASTRLNLVSSALDYSNVIIQGWTATDQYTTEQVTLNGVVDVPTTTGWEKIYSISKKKTDGSISFKDLLNVTTYLRMDHLITDSRVIRIGLFPIPSKATTIYGRGYVRVPQLVYANEKPLGFTEDHINAIVNGSFAKFLRYDTTSNKETIETAMAIYNEEVRKLLALDKQNPDMNFRMRSSKEQRNLHYFRPLDKFTP